MALWFVPLHLFPLTMRPQFPLVSCMLNPGPPQFVQDVTGLGRFMRLPVGQDSNSIPHLNFLRSLSGQVKTGHTGSLQNRP